MPRDDIPEVRGAPVGQGGRKGAPGGARGDQATPDAKISDKTAIYWLQIMVWSNQSLPWVGTPDPKGMIFNHFWCILGHLDALRQIYLVKTQIGRNRNSGGKRVAVSTGKTKHFLVVFGFFTAQNMSQIGGKIQILTIIQQNFAVEWQQKCVFVFRNLEREKIQQIGSFLLWKNLTFRGTPFLRSPNICHPVQVVIMFPKSNRSLQKWSIKHFYCQMLRIKFLHFWCQIRQSAKTGRQDFKYSKYLNPFQ